MRRAEGGPPRPPLGSLAASTGELEAVLARFDAVASRAWLTRRVSALVPARGGLAAGDGASLAARLQLQRASFELQGVPLARLGEQPFADAVRDYQICCLSRGRGLDAGNVVAVLPPGELVASVDVSTFQQLGLEEPARGAKQLRRKLLVGERRHVRIALGVSKTRAARAKRMGEAATSRWSSLVPASERCSLVAYYGREEEGLAAAAGGGGLGLLVDGGAPASLRRLDVPVTLRRLSLGAPGGDGLHIARPPVEALVAEQAPAGGGAAGGAPLPWHLLEAQQASWRNFLLQGMRKQVERVRHQFCLSPKSCVLITEEEWASLESVAVETPWGQAPRGIVAVELGSLISASKRSRTKGGTARFSINVLPELMYFIAPSETYDEVRYRMGSYLATAMLPARVTDGVTGYVSDVTIELGKFPTMTDDARFLLNGNPWILVHRLVKATGVMYSRSTSPQNEIQHRLTLVTLEYPRFTVCTGGPGSFGCGVTVLVPGSESPIPAYVFLRALGFSDGELRRMRNSEALFSDVDKGMEDEAVCQRACDLVGVPAYSIKSYGAASAFRGRINLALQAGIGALGRMKYNDRLGSSVPLHIHYLVPQDLVAAVDLALDLASGAATLQVDDIDSLENRRLRSCGEAMEAIIQRWLSAAADNSGRIRVSVDATRLRGIPDATLSMEESCFRELGNENNIQLADEVNGLSEVVHARKFTQVGDSGLDAIKRIEGIRLVHHTHYGRICPVDTGEGMNAGIVGSLATYARVSADGELVSPHQRVSQGRRYWQEPWTWTRAIDQMHLRVAQFDSAHSADGDLSKPLQRMQAEPEALDNATVVHVGRFTKAPVEGVELIACGSPMSLGTSMIPFLEHDDANRLQMGAKMQSQAVPCKWPERPLVGTGLEAYVAASSSWNKRAELPGQVLYADGREVTLVSSTVTRSEQPSAPDVEGDQSPELPGGWEKRCLQLRSEMSPTWPIDVAASKKHTLHHQSTVANPGGIVSLGDFVAEGSCMSGGEAAIGKNLVAAYLPYEGYNYEDAIVISARLVREHVLTSTHVVELERVLDTDERLSTTLLGSSLPPEGVWVEGGDVLAVVERLKHADLANGAEGMSSEGLPLAPDDLVVGKRDPWKVPDDVRGRVISSGIHRKNHHQRVVTAVTVLVAMDCRIQVGDKVSGRHGNKGIVAKILDDRDMPYLPDGTPLDIILNPLGVPSRMNVGQIFECLLGSAARWTNQEYRIGSYDEMFAEDASRALVFDALGQARDRTGYQWLLDPRAPGKTRLYDGRTGVALDQPVTVGISYILKLIHMVRDKIAARSFGGYSAQTMQPRKGRRMGGGQRLGEMEVSAMVAYGAHSVLQEFVTIKSDDIKGRESTRTALLRGEQVELPQGATSEGYRTFERELAASGFLMQGGRFEHSDEPEV